MWTGVILELKSSEQSMNNSTTTFSSSGFKLNNNNNNNNSNNQTTGIFGQNNNTQNSIFGNTNTNRNTGLFNQTNTTNTSTQSLFGSNTNNTTAGSNTGFGFKTSTGFGTTNTTNTTGTANAFNSTNSLFNKTGTSATTPATATPSGTNTQTTFGFGNTATAKSITPINTSLTNTNTTSKPLFGFSTTSTNTTVAAKPNTTFTSTTASTTTTAATTTEKTTTNKVVSKKEPQITPIIEKNKPVRKKKQSIVIPKKSNSKIKIREYNNDSIQDTSSVSSDDNQNNDNTVIYKRKSNRISKDIQKLLDDYEKEIKENKIKEEIAFNEIKKQTEKLKIEEENQTQKLKNKEKEPETEQDSLIKEQHSLLKNMFIKSENKGINTNEIKLFQEPGTFTNYSEIKKEEIEKGKGKEIEEEEKEVEERVEEVEEESNEKDTIKQISTKRVNVNTIYEVNPPISQLIQMTDEELSNVKNLEVYVKNIGSLKFLKPVDLLSACNGKKRENIPYIFGNIIIIQSKSCTVYPDDRIKPEMGQGLNQPAIIELYSCWAKDKSTGKPILDPTLPSYKRHISYLKRVKDTEFIDYEAIQGKWTFKVEHFTRYGLLTEDDDEEDEYDNILIKSKKELKLKKDGKINRGYGLISTDEESTENEANNISLVINKQTNKDIIVTEVLSEEDIKQKNKLDSMRYCFDNMENAKKLQVMNVSIFGPYNNGKKRSTLKTINYSENLIPLNKSRMARRLEKLNNLKLIGDNNNKSPSKVNMQILNQFKKNFEENKKQINNVLNNDAPIFFLKPKASISLRQENDLNNMSNISTEDLDKLDIVQNNLESIPLYADSIFNKNENFNLLMSRSFRVGWGQNNQITVPSINTSLSPNKIQLGVVSTSKIFFNDEKAIHNILLTALFQSSRIKHELSNDSNKKEISEDIKSAEHFITNPTVVREKSTKPFSNILNVIKPNINTTINKREILMWKLCHVLFDSDDISELEENEDILTDNQKQYIIEMQKKQNIGNWLKESLSDPVNITLERIKMELNELESEDKNEEMEPTNKNEENSAEKKSLIYKLLLQLNDN